MGTKLSSQTGYFTHHIIEKLLHLDDALLHAPSQAGRRRTGNPRGIGSLFCHIIVPSIPLTSQRLQVDKQTHADRRL